MCICRSVPARRSARRACSVSAATASAAPPDCSTPSSRSSASCCRPSTRPSPPSGVAELTEAIKRVALVADRGAQVRMEFADDVLKLSAGADDVGRAEEDLPVAFSGEPLTIAFNPTYLTDGLGSLHSERVTFGFTTPSRPAVLRPAGDDEDGGRWRRGPVPRGADRLRLPVDAGAAPGLTGPTRDERGCTCNWVWSAWAKWASTCGNAFARAGTR